MTRRSPQFGGVALVRAARGCQALYVLCLCYPPLSMTIYDRAPTLWCMSLISHDGLCYQIV